jgi:excinuclease ABC subunit B
VQLELVSDFEPTGDQPRAIEELVAGLREGRSEQILLGVTGSGKTFTVACTLERLARPALVIAHNKTLAAQLYQELSELFPRNAVEYFVSYYDYYQPEAYVPASDTYIEKDASINDRIDRMRHSATRAILTRRDVIVVASVSCIFGIGSAEDYGSMLVTVERGREVGRNRLLRSLVDIQYERNDVDFARGAFRVRGDTVEVFPPYEEEQAVRIEFWGDEVERICTIDPLRGTPLEETSQVVFYPGSHWVTPADQLQRAMDGIRRELEQRLAELDAAGKLVEKQRLAERTMYDLEMLESAGYCSGIENYSRHLSGRAPGEPPPTLLSYFPDDFVVVIDESHQTLPQLRAMYRGDRSRKQTLVEYGFRLPSALDNRPLKFEEFEEIVGQRLYVSATPGDRELERTGGEVVEQIIRPTGLLDPEVEIRPATGQVDDVMAEIRSRVESGERVLVTTLTKRMAEDLTEYLGELGMKAGYLHSDVETLERIDILRDLRTGTIDVLVGINLLREGLDLPEVSLVAILDADKEGFLRSTRSLIQTCGRAARNLRGKVVLYGDETTEAMAATAAETERRRDIQRRYNEAHSITPRSIRKAIRDTRPGAPAADYVDLASVPGEAEGEPVEDVAALTQRLRSEMLAAAANLDFEKAAMLRDRITELTSGRPGRGPAGREGTGRPKRRRPARRRRR